MQKILVEAPASKPGPRPISQTSFRLAAVFRQTPCPSGGHLGDFELGQTHLGGDNPRRVHISHLQKSVLLELEHQLLR